MGLRGILYSKELVNTFDFQDYPDIWERLLLTNGIERAKFASETPAIEALLFMDYIKDVS